MGSGGSLSLCSPGKRVRVIISRISQCSHIDLEICRVINAFSRIQRLSVLHTLQTDWVLYGQASRAISIS